MYLSVLVDQQKVVIIEAEEMRSEGEDYIVVDAENIVKMLGVWRELDPARRGFQWADLGGSDPEPLFIAWTSDAGYLSLEQIPAFWNGRHEVGGHSLEAIGMAVPINTISWERVTEPTA
jgi:hypothetical protein